jgi:RimJ/RimL family protein N-acetyltransferase
MVVRPLAWADYPDLVTTYYLCYDERDRGEPIGITLFTERPGPADEAQWFSGLYRRTLVGDAVVSVAEVDGHVVGSCTIGRVAPRADSEAGHVGELGILVHPAHRGHGLGSALLTDAIRRARQLFSVVRLSVFSTNVRARELYSRMGFQPAGRIPRAIRRGGTYIDEEIMVLLLEK